MSDLEQLQRRVLELAKMHVSVAAFEYYVSSAQFFNLDKNILTIYLDDRSKEFFWTENMKSYIQMAGFEVLDTEIEINYIFSLDNLSTQHLENPNTAPKTTSKSQTPVDSNLKSKFTFNNFIGGDGNRFALAAATTVAKQPGTTYNPLFIWGGPGLGKTHLLNAIGNEALKNNAISKVKYVTTENFINSYVTSIRNNTMERLEEEFRTLDFLLIDDIQFLARKEKTLEEFFNTFETLYNANKQIVLTSDRQPDLLNDIPSRLVTRFQQGLVTNITPPDFETRMAILSEKILEQEAPLEFPNETLEYLATHFESSVRELEGALKDIQFLANFKKTQYVTIDLASEALRARKVGEKAKVSISIEDIQEKVGAFYGVTVREIKSTRRTQSIVLARHVAMYLARELTGSSLPTIGKAFGGRDHTTVLHSHRKIGNMITQEDTLRMEIENLKNKFR